MFGHVFEGCKSLQFDLKLKMRFSYTINPVFIASATITVLCSRNEDENAKGEVRL